MQAFLWNAEQLFNAQNWGWFFSRTDKHIHKHVHKTELNTLGLPEVAKFLITLENSSVMYIFISTLHYSNSQRM